MRYVQRRTDRVFWRIYLLFFGGIKMEISQILMVITLLIMITGRLPIYLTAIVGSTLAAIIAGFPISGKAEITLLKLVYSGINPVIADMTGVLMFIGVMEKTGFLEVVIRKIIQLGTKMGGAPGIAAAGSLVAGIIGALTGFTQPVVTASITGPAAVKMGMDPSKTAGIAAHAGHFGNFAGFTHPTQVAVIATAAIGFGMINVVGAIVGISIIAFSCFRLVREMKIVSKISSDVNLDNMENSILGKVKGISFKIAIIPFVIFVIGFVAGFPLFLTGIICGIVTILLAKIRFNEGETFMLLGVQRIATPLVATIGFLFMSSVMDKIGLVNIISTVLEPIISFSPVLIMLFVSSIAGFLTQSNAAAAAIIIPFLKIVLNAGADPLAVACAAAGGSAVWQYYLTGGPVAALSTVIPVIPGSNLVKANKFQRPAMVFGFFVLFICVCVVNFVD